MAHVLSVVSGKGGTGKTTLCAAIASCLALDGQRVLCLDLDVGLRNLDIALGMSEEPVLTFSSVMRGEYTLEQAAGHPTIEQLRLLTAPVTEQPEALDAAQFGVFLRQARQSYDWIFLDAPAGVGPMFRLATQFADEAVVVCQADPGSQRDAARTADLLCAQALPAKLVVNRVSPQIFRQIRATVDDVMDNVGLPLLGIVPDDFSVTLAAAEGKPLVQYTLRGASLACFHISRRLQGFRVPLMRI